MKTTHAPGCPAFVSVAAMLLSTAAAAAPPVNEEPLSDSWAPSEWGPADKIGAANRRSAASILNAVKLVRLGKVATLGKVYQQDAPAFGSRTWHMVIPGLPTGGPFGEQAGVYNDEFLSAEIGQIGTQFDGPGHIGVVTSKGMFFYNGRYLHDENIDSYGLGPLGVEHVGQVGYVCRGVLLDAAALRGVERIPIPVKNSADDPGVITSKDVEAMVKRQGIAPIGEGDCVFLHTGHGNLWDPKHWDSFDAAEKQQRIAQFNAGEPGFGISACEYLASRKIALTGADNWGTDAIGPGFGGEGPQPLECHIKLQTKRGIWNLENLDLTQLVADKAYEFLFVWSPLKIKGATGSPGNPVAIY